MRKLLDLPNEILLQITRSTPVEDIASFSLCNKHMHLLFGPVLQLHVERKQKYSKIRLIHPHTYTHAYTITSNALMLLCDLLESPTIAHYITKVIIDRCVNASCWLYGFRKSREEGTMLMRKPIAKHKTKLSAELDCCPYIAKSEREDWKSEILAGNEYTAFAFLITLLPNVKSITISDGRFRADRLVEVVFKIARAHRTLPERAHPLQKLAKVRLENCNEDFGTMTSVFKPFCALKSLRTLVGNGLQGSYDDWDNKGESENDDEDENKDSDEKGLQDEGIKADINDDEAGHETKDDTEYKMVESGGGITRLSFKDSALHAQSLEMILRGTKDLREFEYSYDDASSNFGEVEWKPAAILQSLLCYASLSLISLDLNGQYGSWDLRIGDSPSYTNSPRNFKVWRQLRVQDGIFVRDILKKGDIRRVYRIVDILPSSLEQLTLYSSFDHSIDLMRAFKGFPEMKESRLARLEEIELVDDLRIDESLKLACKQVGTEVIQRTSWDVATGSAELICSYERN